jgi:hypothetical protein
LEPAVTRSRLGRLGAPDGRAIRVTEALQRYECPPVKTDVSVLDTLAWNSPATLCFGIGENLYGSTPSPHAAAAVRRSI